MKQSVSKHLMSSHDPDTPEDEGKKFSRNVGIRNPLTQRHILECNLQTKSAVNFHIRRRSIRSEARYRNFQSRCSQKTNTLRCAWMGASSKGPHSTHSTVTMRCIYRQKIFPLCWAYTKWEYLLDHQSESFWDIFTRIRSTERMAALLYTCKVELYYTRRVRKIKIHHV